MFDENDAGLPSRLYRNRPGAAQGHDPGWPSGYLALEHAPRFSAGVGNDERGRILAEKARESGVNVCYQVTDSFPTGVSGR